MGILGLMDFMKRNDCYEQVRLSDAANAYRNKTGKDPVILVDCPSVISFFYTSSPGIMTVSGEFKKFLENFKTFVNKCRELGIELKIFGEGKKPTYKYRLYEKRIAEKVKRLEEVYSGQTNTGVVYRGALFWVATNYLSLKDGFKFSRAIGEADSAIIKYLKTEDCFAVFTNDSDFIIMDNIQYCLTPQNLNLESMTFFNFNRSNLTKLLEINASQLPLFASLCLSHYQCSDLWKFYKKKNISVQNRFLEVAELIRNFTSMEELIQVYLSLMGPEYMIHLERRLKFYFGEEEEEEDVGPTAQQNHWGEILKFAEERHVTGEAHSLILTIIQDKVYFFGPTCENTFKSSPDYALLKIRKKIYGILFFEHPNSLIFVTEFFYEHLKETSDIRRKGRTIIVDRRPHPGLLKLWSPESSVDLKTSRQTVFCEAINEKLTAKDISSLNIPVEYLFPILVAFHFLWELDKKFKDFEVETILIQAVLVNRLTEEQIDQLPEEFHVDAVDLTGWFFAFLNCFYFLNGVCGKPFCLDKINLCNFFDGKVMQYVYGKMKEEENPWTPFFGQHEKEYETLMSVLYELGRICGHVKTKEKNGFILNGYTTN